VKKHRLRPGDVLVIYATATGRMRGGVMSDEDKQHPWDVLPGHSVLTIPKRYLGVKRLSDFVKDHSGITPPSDRHCVVDIRSGVVTGAILCDPTLDPKPDGVLWIQSDTAGPGWTYEPRTGVFTPPPQPAVPPKVLQ
jgi:hypothetical protein